MRVISAGETASVSSFGLGFGAGQLSRIFTSSVSGFFGASCCPARSVGATSIVTKSRCFMIESSARRAPNVHREPRNSQRAHHGGAVLVRARGADGPAVPRSVHAPHLAAVRRTRARAAESAILRRRRVLALQLRP